MSAAKLSDEDVERIAEAVARKLRDTKPHNERPAKRSRVASPEMLEKIAKKLRR